jgi:hypothetical protein
MEDPALVFDDTLPPGAAGVHAIVIGIGHYRHFPGGAGDEFDAGDEPIEQLSSPPHSARAVADWLLAAYHKDATHPLRSLSLVIAEPSGSAIYAHLLCPEREVPDAKIEDIRGAVQAWKARGDANVDNLMLFYICCHGISAGLQHTLLASDFGADVNNPFRHAIDFTQFHQGMAKCAATKQVYFIDACRVLSDNLFRDGSKGDPIISSDGKILQRSAPVFRSTLAGSSAWGLNNRPSAFAQALPLAFRGGAWRRENGQWLVCSSLLKLALEQQIKRVMWQYRNFPSLIDRDNDVTLTLKVPDARAIPCVPVDVSCDPVAANEFVSLSVQAFSSKKITQVPSRKASRDSWLLDLDSGMYTIAAKFPGLQFNKAANPNVIVHPPNGSERIKVV